MPRPAESELVAAIHAEDWSAVQQALARGVDPRSGHPGFRYLLGAAAHRDAPTELLQALIQRARASFDNEPDILGRCARIAVERGRRDLLRALLELGVPVDHQDEHGRTLLMSALRHGQPETATMLLNQGADACAHAPNGDTPLASGAAAAPLSLLRRLMEAGASTTGSLLLLAAVPADDPARLDILTEAGAALDLSTGGAGLIHTAAATGAPRSLDWLLQQGADPNARGLNGATPLAQAIREHRGTEAELLIVVERLLAAGADPDIPDHSSPPHRPADLAAARGCYDVARRLDPDAPAPDLEYAPIASIVLRDDAMYSIVFRPNDRLDTFLLGRGHYHDRMYGTATAGVALERYWHEFEEAGLGWFRPLLERLAGGEVLPLRELTACYQRHEQRAPVIQRFEET